MRGWRWLILYIRYDGRSTNAGVNGQNRAHIMGIFRVPAAGLS